MDRDELYDLFEKYDDEYLKFERVENPPSQYADLCILLLLEKLVPCEKPGRDILGGANHDIVYLGSGYKFMEKLAEVITEEDVIYLRRCGVHYDSDAGCLAFFV